MIEIPFYQATPMDLKTVVLFGSVFCLSYFLFVGIFCGRQALTQLKSPSLVLVPSLLIALTLASGVVAYNSAREATKLEGVFERIVELGLVADELNLPLDAGLQGFHDEALAISQQDSPWHQHIGVMEQALTEHLDLEGNAVHGYVYSNGRARTKLKPPFLSKDDHLRLTENVHACTAGQPVPEDYRILDARYPTITKKLVKSLTALYKAPNIDWIDRQCFSDFSLSWVLKQQDKTSM